MGLKEEEEEEEEELEEARCLASSARPRPTTLGKVGEDRWQVALARMQGARL